MKHLTFEKKKKLLFWTGISILVLCSFAFLVLFTNLIKPVKHFLLGTFGLFSYPLFIVLFVVGLAIINKKKYVLPAKYAIYLTCALISLLALIQNIFVGNFSGGFFEFLAYNYTKQLTPGGIIIGIFISPFKFAFGSAGVYAVFAILLIVFVCLIADYLMFVRKKAKENAPIKVQRQKEEQKRQKNLEEVKKQSQTQGDWMLDREGNLIGKDGELFSQKQDDIHAKTISKLDKAIEKRKNKEKPKITLDAQIEHEEILEIKNQSARQKLGLIKSGTVIESSEPIKKEPTLRERFEKNELSRKEYLLTPPNLSEMTIFNREQVSNNTIRDEINSNFSALKEEQKTITNFNQNIQQNNVKFEEPIEESSSTSFVDFDDESSFNTPESKAVAGNIIEQIMNDEKEINISAESLKQKPVQQPKPQVQPIKPIQPVEQPKEQPKPVRKPFKYVAPTCDLLFDVKSDNSDLQESVQKKAVVLENALETFNINAKVIRIVVGPSVTRYELEMPVGVPVKKVLAHQDDIALYLASIGDIRIEAPIPGRSAVGIEVPNDKISMVGIKEILSSDKFKDARSPLTFALGKEISGDIRVCNLEKMPHLLVAGSTGSGKSVCLNTLIISMLYKASPDDLKLILIDPKCVEFSMYNGLPHMLIPNAITEPDKAVNSLTWAVNEMERRYKLFQESRSRNLAEYNNTQKVLSGEVEKLPLIVIIIDELADLMMLAKKELEEKLMRLAQKARAAGIHLILATQRPSVNVLTGPIKTNFPSRIAFAVTSFVDSKTILDKGGAEKLLGKGDMLYAPNDQAEPTRIQGCYIDGKEVENVVEFVKQNNSTYEHDLEQANKVVSDAPKAYGGNPFAHNPNESDDLMPYALKLFIENGQASITMLQRRFRIGFSRAANIVDEMEQKGYIGPAEGSKQRQVLMTMDEYNSLFGDVE